MGDQHSRRTLLRAGAGVVGAGLLAGCTDLQFGSDGRIAELEARVEELEAENERLRKTRSGASSTAEFSEAVRSRAESVGESAREAVVFLQQNDGDDNYTHGAGWFYGSDRILTNAHVVRGAAELTAYTLHGDEIDVSVVATTDSSNDMLDVALLETPADAPATLPTASSETLSPEQPVVQVGHPSYVANWAVSLGAFKRRDRVGRLETQIPVHGGNSGGPLLTLDGEVVGMTFSSSSVEELRDADEAPEPTGVSLYEEYPYQREIYAAQDPIEVVQKKVQSWLE